MKNTFFKASGRNLLTCAICALMAMPASSQQALSLKDYEYTTREWKRIVRNSPDSFFTTDEAKRIADNVLAFQRTTGGWPKNASSG